jgi:hypothetical protein
MTSKTPNQKQPQSSIRKLAKKPETLDSVTQLRRTNSVQDFVSSTPHRSLVVPLSPQNDENGMDLDVASPVDDVDSNESSFRVDLDPNRTMVTNNLHPFGPQSHPKEEKNGLINLNTNIPAYKGSKFELFNDDVQKYTVKTQNVLNQYHGVSREKQKAFIVQSWANSTEEAMSLFMLRNPQATIDDIFVALRENQKLDVSKKTARYSSWHIRVHSTFQDADRLSNTDYVGKSKSKLVEALQMAALHEHNVAYMMASVALGTHASTISSSKNKHDSPYVILTRAFEEEREKDSNITNGNVDYSKVFDQMVIRCMQLSFNPYHRDGSDIVDPADRPPRYAGTHSKNNSIDRRQRNRNDHRDAPYSKDQRKDKPSGNPQHPSGNPQHPNQIKEKTLPEKSTSPCTFFKQGRCTKQDKCRFSHG